MVYCDKISTGVFIVLPLGQHLFSIRPKIEQRISKNRQESDAMNCSFYRIKILTSIKLVTRRKGL
jgi:hypothetical protein